MDIIAIMPANLDPAASRPASDHIRVNPNIATQMAATLHRAFDGVCIDGTHRLIQWQAAGDATLGIRVDSAGADRLGSVGSPRS